MKRNTILLLAALGIIAAGCAKEPKTDTKQSDKTYFDSWVTSHYPDAELVGYPGSDAYILEKEEGAGQEAAPTYDDDQFLTVEPYLWVDYTSSDLEGNVIFSTYENIDKRIGTYSKPIYYGPQIWYHEIGTAGHMYSGLYYATERMRIGERRKVAIPYWLLTFNSYSTPEEYLKKAETGASHIIYDVTLRNFCYNIKDWQGEQLNAYSAEHLNGADSTYIAGNEENNKFGFYFVSKGIAREKDREYTMPTDTTLYLNYTGKLLNGHIFDTTLKNVAKDAGLYDPAKTYAPIQINRKEKYTDISYGSDESDLIEGFKAAIFMMHPMEKAVAAFWSGLGYGATGTGYTIPPYSPLVFELELVAKPE